MVKTTVPVITGGKSLRIGFMKRPTRVAMTPPTSMAPATAAMPPLPVAMACMLGRYAKLTPNITGRPEPKRPPMGKSCRSVVTADSTRDAWISSTCSRWVRAAAWATIMAGVTQPTIMATKCCRAMETVRPTGGRPRYRNSAWGSAVNFRMV